MTRRGPAGPAHRWTVGVCGFARCGSSMTMAMLEAGGLPPVDAAKPGSYETEMADLLMPQPAGRAIKLLEAVVVVGVPRALAWRFVWLDRDPVQQARSMIKMLGAVGGEIVATVEEVAASIAIDRPRALGALRRIGPVLVLDYERVLIDPRRAAKALRRDVWPPLDVAAAAAVVHQRDGICRPDLTVEGIDMNREDVPL